MIYTISTKYKYGWVNLDESGKIVMACEGFKKWVGVNIQSLTEILSEKNFKLRLIPKE